MPLTSEDAAAEIRRLMVLAYAVPLTAELLENALNAVKAHRLPLWDAQILAAAKLHQANIVLSEDFGHRQTIDGVTFVNPFAPDFVISEILSP